MQARLDAAVVEARAWLTMERVFGGQSPLGTLDLVPLDAATARSRFGLTLDADREVAFFAELPEIETDCANRLRVSVRVKDAAGESFPSKGIDTACQKLSFIRPSQCRFGLGLSQSFRGCSASPDVVYVSAGGYAERPAHVTIEGGSPESPVVVDSFDFVPTPQQQSFVRNYEVSVDGYSGDVYPLRGRLVPHEPEFLPGAQASTFAVVDRAPPVPTFLLPPEGGSICLARNDAAPPLATLALVDDASPRVEPSASWRSDGGPWGPLPRLNCDAACQKDPTVPTGRPFALDWNAAQLDSGWYELQLRVCDRSGNQGSVARRVLVTRDAPFLQIVGVRSPAFSPNGDGRVEETQVTARPAQAGNLSVRVHAGKPDGGALVRSLFARRSPGGDRRPRRVGRPRRHRPGRPRRRVRRSSSRPPTRAAATGEASAAVEVDTVPPEVAITDPAAASG